MSPRAEALAEIHARLRNLVMIGTVAELDAARGRVRVAYGDPEQDPRPRTRWIPWLAGLAGPAEEASAWAAPAVGSQVAVLSIGGDPQLGIVLGAIYSTATPPPSREPQKLAMRASDGAAIVYDPAATRAEVTLPEGGTLRLNVPGGARLEGDLEVRGRITATGNVESRGDVQDKRGRTLDQLRSQYNRHTHLPGGIPAPMFRDPPVPT